MNNEKNNFKPTPIERHDTAAWANIESTKEISNVSVPDESETMHAKEHVDKMRNKKSCLRGFGIF